MYCFTKNGFPEIRYPSENNKVVGYRAQHTSKKQPPSLIIMRVTFLPAFKLYTISTESNEAKRAQELLKDFQDIILFNNNCIFKGAFLRRSSVSCTLFHKIYSKIVLLLISDHRWMIMTTIQTKIGKI